MLKEKIGAMLIILGVVTADSEWLIIPIALVGLGIFLIKGVIEW